MKSVIAGVLLGGLGDVLFGLEGFVGGIVLSAILLAAG